MKQVLFRRRSNWSSSAKILAALCLLCVAAAADEVKDRKKNIRELARQGSPAIPQIAASLSDPDSGVRLDAVLAIVDIGTQASLDPLVKALSDNSSEIQARSVDGLVNFYLPGYVEKTGLTTPFKKLGAAVKSRFTDTNDQVIDPFITVRPDVIEAMGKVARGGSSTDARAAAARGLGILRGKAAVPALIEALHSNDTQVNYECLIAIQKIRDPAAGPLILFRLRDPSEKVSIAAIETTGLLENRAAVNQLRDAMDRAKSIKVKRAALTAMAIMPDPSTHGVFLYHLEDKDEGIRVAAVEGLARGKNPADTPVLEKLWNEEKRAPVRLAAAFGLVYAGRREMTELAPLRYLVNQLNSAGYRGVAIPYLRELTRDLDTRVAVYAAFQSPTKDEKSGLCEIFSYSGDRTTVPYLEKLSKDTNPDIGKQALRALQSIQAR